MEGGPTPAGGAVVAAVATSGFSLSDVMVEHRESAEGQSRRPRQLQLVRGRTRS
jgi:hypothetical protein